MNHRSKVAAGLTLIFIVLLMGLALPALARTNRNISQLAPSATASDTPTDTAVPPSATASDTPTNTIVPASATASDTPTNTIVPASATASDTPTNTIVPASATASDTPTNTIVPASATASDTPTNTIVPASATASDTPTNTAIAASATASDTPTNTAIAASSTPSNTPTVTLSPTASKTPTPVPSRTPTATATSTPRPRGPQGCSATYWRTHLGSWGATGYSPNQTLESVFDVPDAYGLDNNTLMQALGFTLGFDKAGAARWLLRSGVASLLNAAHPSVNFPLTTRQVITGVNYVLSTNNRNAMLVSAAILDVYNLRSCPLN